MEREALEQLAESIRAHGVIQPVVVTRTYDGYQLVAGERRIRAAEIAGLDRVPAVVRDAAPRDQLELALIENIQRSDLNALEEAAAYRQLMDEFGLSQEDVANRVGRSRPSIANALRLLQLAQPVQQALAEGSITEGHARAIAGLEDASVQETVLAAVVARQLSVRDTEELTRRMKDGATFRRTVAAAAAPDPDLERFEMDLRTALGTKVSVATSRRGGRIVIEYYDRDDLNRLYDRLVGASA
jgi:ParB family chromosome partitioning protein